MVWWHLHYTRACRLQLVKEGLIECKRKACTIPVHVDCNRLPCKSTMYLAFLHYTRACRLQLRTLYTGMPVSCLALYPCMQIATAKTQIQTAYGINIVCVNLIECIHYTKKLRFYNVLSRFTDAKPPGLNVNYTFALNLYYNTARLSCQYL